MLLRYLASSLLRSVTNKQPYIKRKANKKETKQLASYLTGFNSPLYHTSIGLHLQKELHSHKPEHINTYPQEPKWTTFSRVRPSTALLSCSFFTKTKKWGVVVGIQGLAGPLSLPCWGKTGLCDKDTHTKAVQMKHKLGHRRSR